MQNPEIPLEPEVPELPLVPDEPLVPDVPLEPEDPSPPEAPAKFTHQFLALPDPAEVTVTVRAPVAETYEDTVPSRVLVKVILSCITIDWPGV